LPKKAKLRNTEENQTTVAEENRKIPLLITMFGMQTIFNALTGDIL